MSAGRDAAATSGRPREAQNLIIPHFHSQIVPESQDLWLIRFLEGSIVAMKIEYFHASKYGNGVVVAEEFKKRMAARGIAVSVRHIREARPKEMPPADLYLFSSPGRLGKPIGAMRRFLKKANLPPAAKYAILTTEMPTPEERSKWRRVIPIMSRILQEKGLVEVAQGTILVTGIKGPLEEGWQKKVEAFVSQISSSPAKETPRP